jgi:glutamate racemase
MDNRPVLFLDSGVGGIPYCCDFIKRNPKEIVYYLADRENFPYGPREKEEIAAILISLTAKLITKIDPKLAVLACNTASISALQPLRKTFPNLPFVGTVPALKPAAQASKCGKIGVLATERTINDIPNLHLETGNCEIIGIAAPELVEFIEQSFDKASRSEKAETVKKYIDLFREKGVDSLVLGCTHFLYLHDEFLQCAQPGINIFDSLEGITKRIEYLLNENSSALRADNTQSCNLVLTGTQPPDAFWKTRAETLKFNLCLIDNL